MKFCTNCGAQIKDEALFCPKCGSRVKTAPNMNAAAGQASTAADQANTTAPNENQQNAYQANSGQTYNYGQANAGQANTAANTGNNSQEASGYYTDQYTKVQRPVFNNAQTAVIGYLSWLGFLIGMVGGDRKDPYARFHLGQSLLMNIVMICGAILNAIGTALMAAGYIGYAYSYYLGYGGVRGAAYAFGVIFVILGSVTVIYTFVCWIIALVRACKGSAKPVPIFGKFKLLK